LRKRQKEELLTASPLGWKNIERFLKLAPCNIGGSERLLLERFAQRHEQRLFLIPEPVSDRV
jgi:hypothetical protein